jgi:hypothetical protein
MVREEALEEGEEEDLSVPTKGRRMEQGVARKVETAGAHRNQGGQAVVETLTEDDNSVLRPGRLNESPSSYQAVRYPAGQMGNKTACSCVVLQDTINVSTAITTADGK